MSCLGTQVPAEPSAAQDAKRDVPWMRQASADAVSSENGAIFRQSALALAYAMACTAIALPHAAEAAEWKAQPGVELRETYTDNLRLAAHGAEAGDFVTEISPRLALNGTGARLKFHAMYEMRNFFYAREGGSQTLHLFGAAANAELARDWLFLDANAGVSPQNISPFGSQAANTGNLTDNRTQVRTYSISPYLLHEFWQAARSELRYTHDGVTTTSNTLDTTHGDRVHLKVASGPAFKTLLWDVQYDAQQIRYENSADIDSKAIAGNARYVLSRQFSLTGGAGYEKNSYLSIQQKPEGAFWSTGVVWTPSGRTNVAASVGKRFFGTTYSLAGSHQTRATVWSVGYQEELTTVRSQYLMPATADTPAFLNQLWAASIPDPATRAQVVSEFIHDTGLATSLSAPTSGFTNRVFLQKNLQASVAFRNVRNTLVINAFRTNRSPQSAAEADTTLPQENAAGLAATLRQYGGGVLWNWRLAPRLAANFETSYSTARANGAKTDYYLVRIGFARQLSPKSRGGIDLIRRMQDSSLHDSDYRENTIAAFVSIGI